MSTLTCCTLQGLELLFCPLVGFTLFNKASGLAADMHFTALFCQPDLAFTLGKTGFLSFR